MYLVGLLQFEVKMSPQGDYGYSIWESEGWGGMENFADPLSYFYFCRPSPMFFFLGGGPFRTFSPFEIMSDKKTKLTFSESLIMLGVIQ